MWLFKTSVYSYCTFVTWLFLGWGFCCCVWFLSLYPWENVSEWSCFILCCAWLGCVIVLYCPPSIPRFTLWILKPSPCSFPLILLLSSPCSLHLGLFTTTFQTKLSLPRYPSHLKIFLILLLILAQPTVPPSLISCCAILTYWSSSSYWSYIKLSVWCLCYGPPSLDGGFCGWYCSKKLVPSAWAHALT